MPLSDIIGRIRYEAEVDPSGVKAGAEQIEQEVRASMAAIDKMRAEAEIDADKRELDRKILEAKRELEALDQERAEVEIDADTSKLDKRIAQARRDIKQLSNERAEIQFEDRQLKKYQRELVRATNEYNRLSTAEERATLTAKKQGLEVEKLRGRYSRLTAEMHKINRLRFWQKSDVDKQRLREIGAELDLTRHRLTALGDDTSDLDDDMERSAGTLQRWGHALLTTRVHLGFLSTTMRGFGVGLVTLGPIITGIIGTVSALVGVLAEGVVGAVGLAAAGVAGLGLAFGGISAAVSPALADLKLARTAFANYHKAVVTYGKGSDEAQAAQEKLNETLKNVDPAVAGAAQQLDKLSNTYQKLTEPTRQEFFKTLETGLRQAQNLLPGFAHNINQTARTAGSAFRDLFRDLGTSPEFRQAINTLQDNFRRAIPSMVQSLGNLTKAAGNVFAAFSRHFGGAGRSFQQFTRGILQSSRDTQSLNNWVDDLMDSLSGVTRFLGAAGNTLWSFFTAGSDQGLSLLDRMTDGLNDITDWINSAQGKASLANFFDDAVNTTERLWGAIKSVGAVLLEVSEAFRPLVDGLLQAVDIAGKLVDALADIKIPGIDANLAQIAGLAFGLSKLWGIAKKIPGIGGLLGGLFGSAGAGAAGASMAEAGAGAGALAAGLRTIGLSAIRFAGPIGALFTGLKLIDDNTGIFGGDAQENIAKTAQEVDNWVQSVRDSGSKIRELARGSDDAFDDLFGEGAAAQIQRTDTALKGFGQQVRNSAAQLANLGKQGLSKSFRIQTKLSDGNTGDKLRQLSRQASQLGKSDATVRILANTSSAEKNVHQLENLIDKATKQRNASIQARTTEAVNAFHKVASEGDKAAKPRTAPIKEQGTSDVLNKFHSIESFKIPDKTVSVRVQDYATAGLQAVAAVLASLHDKTIHVTTVNSTIGGRGNFMGGIEGYAKGGMVARAAALAAGRTPIKSGKGAKVDSPRYVVGEEHMREYIIAMNPAYRARNATLLASAASEMGYALVEAFRKGGARGKKPNGGGNGGGSKKPPKSTATGGLTSPDSKYTDLRNRIDQNESEFANMQREHDLTGIWTVADLISKKDKSITGVERLIDHIKSVMIPALDRITGTAAAKFRNVPKKPGKKPHEPKKPGSNAGNKAKEEYQRKLAKYQREKAEWEAAKSRRQSVVQANKQGIKDGKGLRASLLAEVENLRAEKEGYRLDEVELGAPDTGSDAPTLAEQTASANQARYDLFRSMSSNFIPLAAAFGQTALQNAGVGLAASVGSAAATGMTDAARQAVATTGSQLAASAGAAGGASGNTVINQTNNYATAPENPHLFSENLAYELGTIR